MGPNFATNNFWAGKYILKKSIPANDSILKIAFDGKEACDKP